MVLVGIGYREIDGREGTFEGCQVLPSGANSGDCANGRSANDTVRAYATNDLHDDDPVEDVRQDESQRGHAQTLDGRHVFGGKGCSVAREEGKQRTDGSGRGYYYGLGAI